MELFLRNKGALILLMVNIFLIFTGIGLVIPIMPTFMRIHNIGGTIAGLLVATFAFSQLVFSPAAGHMSDQIGRKKIIVFGILIFGVSEILFGLSDSLFFLFFARILGGISAALIMPGIMAYVADITSNEERAKGIGYLNAALSTGFIIGPGIGGYLAEFGMRVPFYAAGAVGFIAALVTALVLPETAPKTKPFTGKRESFVSQLRNSPQEIFFPALLLVFVITFGLANYESIFSLFVDLKLGFSPKEIAFIITFGSIGGAIVQMTLFSALLNRFGEKNVIAICLFFVSLFMFLTLLFSDFWIIFVITSLVFLNMDILRPAIGVQLTKMAGDRQGYVAGMNSAFTSLGNIAGPIVGGLLFDVNLNFPYGLGSIVTFISFLLLVIVGWKAQKNKPA